MVNPEQTPECVRQEKGSPGLSPSLLPSPDGGKEGLGRSLRSGATSPAMLSQHLSLYGPTPPPPRTAQRHRPRARGVSRRTRAPPGCCGAVHSRLPRGPQDPAIPGGGHAGSPCSAQRRLHPWSRVRLIESPRVAVAAASSSSSRALLLGPPPPEPLPPPPRVPSPAPLHGPEGL